MRKQIKPPWEPDNDPPVVTEQFQAQAPICPYCYDDHSSTTDCDVDSLKKEILLTRFNEFERTCRDEKQDGSLPDKIRRLIEWF